MPPIDAPRVSPTTHHDTLPSTAPSSAVSWRWSADALTLMMSVLGALVVGVVMLYSSSTYTARVEGHAANYYVIKQLLGLAVGALACFTLARWDAQHLQRLAWPLMGLALVTMTVVVLPWTEHLAPRINGSRRFLIGGSLQPSEFAKAAVVIWTAYLLEKKGGQLRHFFSGIVPFLLIVGACAGLAALEPDLSVAMLYALQLAILLWLGGARLGHFLVLGVIGALALWVSFDHGGYISARLDAFVNGGAPAIEHSINYQLAQSLIAVGSGGVTGVGIGNGRQAAGYVPFPYSDFLGATIGEELGLIGLIMVAALFVVYAVAGLRIAAHARTPFLTFVATGLTLTTVITALLHLGVIVGAFPTTGLGLPFMSYGRSNLVLSLAMTGVLVNIGSTPVRRLKRARQSP